MSCSRVVLVRTGGNGVYSLGGLALPAFLASFSFLVWSGTRRCTFFFLNFGKNRSQFSLASFGSLANSLQPTTPPPNQVR